MLKSVTYVLYILLLCFSNLLYCYRIGVGRADCTGPPVEIVFMGYAQLSQCGEGLHLRQFSRSFIVEKDGERVVFVSVDGAMISHLIKQAVINKLEKHFPALYTMSNVMISGTHSHGTPGGFMMYLLYDLTTFGFAKETYQALVNGIFTSISRAHNNMQDGRVYYDKIEVLHASINRSPLSYLNNPEAERSKYKYDTDKTLYQMQFVDENSTLIGAFNWFAVHPTSMNNTNRLVSSDNVGFASILLEQAMNPDSLPGQGKFVGAFASANLGDVSPNTKGPKCVNTGDNCDSLTSSCLPGGGRCVASGPGVNQFDSTRIIAKYLYNAALDLLQNLKGKEVLGNIKYIHQNIDMPKYEVKYLNPKTLTTEIVKGCVPALGYSFAAGTTDGPGGFDFTQATLSGNPLWNTVRDFLASPTPEDIKCHAPKPILLATGRLTFPYDWTPNIVSTQLFQIGNLFIAGLPGEFTTMSGRRMRNSLQNIALQWETEVLEIILAGLSNQYTSYITTPDEYVIQRYEAASTLYGPHTLTIYIEQYQRLLFAMIKNKVLPPGPEHIDFQNRLVSLVTPVLFDGTPNRKIFGEVSRQPLATYKIGDQVSVEFISGNPRNNLQHEKTYFTVLRKIRNSDDWEIVATDASWETAFRWRRTSFVMGHSTMEVIWEIPIDKRSVGTYKIRLFGDARHIFGGLRSYQGESNTFIVVSD